MCIFYWNLKFKVFTLRPPLTLCTFSKRTSTSTGQSQKPNRLQSPSHQSTFFSNLSDPCLLGRFSLGVRREVWGLRLEFYPRDNGAVWLLNLNHVRLLVRPALVAHRVFPFRALLRVFRQPDVPALPAHARLAHAVGGSSVRASLEHLAVVAQAQKTRFKLKALLSFSQSKFETRCFQAGVKLALPYLEHGARLRAHVRPKHRLLLAVVAQQRLSHKTSGFKLKAPSCPFHNQNVLETGVVLSKSRGRACTSALYNTHTGTHRYTIHIQSACTSSALYITHTGTLYIYSQLAPPPPPPRTGHRPSGLCSPPTSSRT